jgi:hypothetical protein
MVYNPGGQLGKSIRGTQRPAKDRKGPFLGKSARSSKASRGNPNPRSGTDSGPAGTRRGKGKHAPQKQKG